GVSVLVSRHMATSLGLSMAKTLNMTLVGYVRSGKMFVFPGIKHFHAPYSDHLLRPACPLIRQKKTD
ncbi:MAG: formate dehydrogenase accessory sulfurtransferase FdhD, partial [Deltaproteobacteria bacterium]|nr:formate dehydrogenase accessory sulfurtransferase FdhD [Deltaproteobacteria bacterium]